MKALLATVSLLALLLCLLMPVWFFTGLIGESDLKAGFLILSVVWFVFATLWSRHRENKAVE